MNKQTIAAVAIAIAIMLAIAIWVFAPVLAMLKSSDTTGGDIDAVIATMNDGGRGDRTMFRAGVNAVVFDGVDVHAAHEQHAAEIYKK